MLLRPGLEFGGDYNPEQWDATTWPHDVRLMRETGVTMVTVGVFSWSWLEPAPGSFDFAWLDQVMDLCADTDIGVDLATATASPPPWLTHEYPEVLPVDKLGHRLWPGSRQAYCPSSTAFQTRAATLVDRLATRYGSHPALRLWHVGNEYANHVTSCWCAVCAEAFRRWLADRYVTVADLNQAWGTAFWSQRYSSFDEIHPPRLTPSFGNPAQALDFRRFSCAQHLACFTNERDILRRITPEVPVTTNFMSFSDVVDCWRWADEVDVVSNDHYLKAADADNHVELAFNADLTRGLSRRRPWLLMEHSTSAVNWQPRNVAKRPGEMLRNSLQHVARGADGVLFFQWRQSQAGAERFHSAIVPHAGTDSRVWREATDLGSVLARLAPVAGSRVDSEVALIFDYESAWALEGEAMPTVDVSYRDRAIAFHAALWREGITVDMVPPGADLSSYRLVLVPTLHLVRDRDAAAIEAYVRAGGHVVITYFSGIVDEHTHVRLNGYPGAFRDLLGVRSEEFCPLRQDEHVSLVGPDGQRVGSADVWTEDLTCDTSTSIMTYLDGPVAGRPAVTRNDYGAGRAWYLATRTDEDTTFALLQQICAEAGVAPATSTPAGVEVVRRTGPKGAFHFVLNHTDEAVVVQIGGLDLVSGAAGDSHHVEAGGVAVISAPDQDSP